MKKQHIIKAFAILATCAFCSCNEYTDDLQGLGKRVEKLEADTLALKNSIETMKQLQIAMEEQGIVKNIIENADGTTTLEFLNGRESITFVNNGTDGKTTGQLLGIKKGEDGVNYWTFGDNGEWLLDEYGNKISADPIDGKNGTDGEDGKDADPSSSPVIMPQVRVNQNGYWEMSTDGGTTWVLIKNASHPYGIKAVGQQGDPGPNGTADPIFINARYTADYVYFDVWYNGNKTTIKLKRV